MIDARELRIGNKVLFDSDIDTIVSIGERACNAEFKSWWQYDRVHPIHVTPDILVKCGCKKLDSDIVEYWINIDDVGIVISLDINGNWYISAGRKIIIKSLHQFQNTCYSLTGKELEIKI